MDDNTKNNLIDYLGMNKQIKEEGLSDAYLLGKYDGIKQGRADVIEEVESAINGIIKEYIEKYGADIIELYVDVVMEFEEWLKKQK